MNKIALLHNAVNSLQYPVKRSRMKASTMPMISSEYKSPCWKSMWIPTNFISGQLKSDETWSNESEFFSGFHWWAAGPFRKTEENGISREGAVGAIKVWAPIGSAVRQSLSVTIATTFLSSWDSRSKEISSAGKAEEPTVAKFKMYSPVIVQKKLPTEFGLHDAHLKLKGMERCSTGNKKTFRTNLARN